MSGVGTLIWLFRLKRDGGRGGFLSRDAWCVEWEPPLEKVMNKLAGLQRGQSIGILGKDGCNWVAPPLLFAGVGVNAQVATTAGRTVPMCLGKTSYLGEPVALSSLMHP